MSVLAGRKVHLSDDLAVALPESTGVDETRNANRGELASVETDGLRLPVIQTQERSATVADQLSAKYRQAIDPTGNSTSPAEDGAHPPAGPRLLRLHRQQRHRSMAFSWRSTTATWFGSSSPTTTVRLTCSTLTCR
jgi:hypothetical protein